MAAERDVCTGSRGLPLPCPVAPLPCRWGRAPQRVGEGGRQRVEKCVARAFTSPATAPQDQRGPCVRRAISAFGF